MGNQFYPKKIRSILRGENPKVQIGYTGKAESAIRKEGDTWIDKEGKQWEVKNGIIQSIPKFQDIRVPLFCPKCNNIMGKRSKDVQVYYMFGFCLNCLIERDVKMKEEGTFKDYEEKYIKSKQLGFYKDAKIEIEEYLKNLENDDSIKFLNEDGTYEKWTGEEKNKMKEFWEKELDEVNKKLEDLEEN